MLTFLAKDLLLQAIISLSMGRSSAHAVTPRGNGEGRNSRRLKHQSGDVVPVRVCGLRHAGSGVLALGTFGRTRTDNHIGNGGAATEDLGISAVSVDRNKAWVATERIRARFSTAVTVSEA